MIVSIMCVALVGLVISLYGYYVENKIQADSTYKPACDISDAISCSKPIRSEYGKLFLVSNTTLGMVYYASMMILAFFDYYYAAFLLAIASVCVSVVLAYILFFKVKSLCLLCVSVYVVNIVLLIVAYKSL